MGDLKACRSNNTIYTNKRSVPATQFVLLWKQWKGECNGGTALMSWVVSESRNEGLLGRDTLMREGSQVVNSNMNHWLKSCDRTSRLQGKSTQGSINSLTCLLEMRTDALGLPHPRTLAWPHSQSTLSGSGLRISYAIAHNTGNMHNTSHTSAGRNLNKVVI